MHFTFSFYNKFIILVNSLLSFKFLALFWLCVLILVFIGDISFKSLQSHIESNSGASKGAGATPTDKDHPASPEGATDADRANYAERRRREEAEAGARDAATLLEEHRVRRARARLVAIRAAIKGIAAGAIAGRAAARAAREAEEASTADKSPALPLDADGPDFPEDPIVVVIVICVLFIVKIFS